MNGLEAINKLKNESYCNCSLSDDNEYFCMGGLLKDTDEIKAIESELKVAKILKEKKVDIGHIEYILDFTAKIKPEMSQEQILNVETRTYNELWVEQDKESNSKHLEVEEMKLIKEWLKGE